MITGPILNNVPLRCVWDLFGRFSHISCVFLVQSLVNFHIISSFPDADIFLSFASILFFSNFLVLVWSINIYSYSLWWKAVCYLNSYRKDFNGGLFHFQDGEPTTIEPLAGVSEVVYGFLWYHFSVPALVETWEHHLLLYTINRVIIFMSERNERGKLKPICTSALMVVSQVQRTFFFWIVISVSTW